eukprot:9283324-Prorocentrum_lima.AAC.1
MERSEAPEQDDLLDLEMLEALSEQLSNAMVPIHTPPGNLFSLPLVWVKQGQMVVPEHLLHDS